MTTEVAISSVFDLKTREEVTKFLELLRSHLLQEISDINHVVEWMNLEVVECEKSVVVELVVKAKPRMARD